MAKYRTAIVSFFDILGFSTLFTPGHDPNKIEKILNMFRNANKHDPRLPRLNNVRVLNFSDSIIRVLYLDEAQSSGLGMGALVIELEDIAMIQAGLIEEGILIRGGITIDEIFVDHDTIFGPGLNKAYAVESKIASYPRVAIDRQLFDFFERRSELWGSPSEIKSEKERLSDVLSSDSDGVWFIDYLKLSRHYDFDDNFMELLNKQKELVLSEVQKLNKFDGIALKYNWLACYHNSFAPQNLKISSDNVPMLYEL